MYFIYKPYTEHYTSKSTNEEFGVIFVSKRLIKLMVKMTAQYKWRFKYFALIQSSYLGYTPILIGLNKIIIMQKD